MEQEYIRELVQLSSEVQKLSEKIGENVSIFTVLKDEESDETFSQGQIGRHYHIHRFSNKEWKDDSFNIINC